MLEWVAVIRDNQELYSGGIPLTIYKDSLKASTVEMDAKGIAKVESTR